MAVDIVFRAHGSRDVERESDSVKRSLGGVDDAAQRASRSMIESGSKAGGAFDGSDRSARSLTGSLRDVNTSFQAMGNLIGLIKFPALITGAGLAAQGIAALAGGVVALGGALAPLSGLMAALPIGMGAVVAATGTVKLAFAGFEDAMKGTEGAMAKLSPAAREFAGTLKEFEPVLNAVRAAAGKDLFPALTEALKTVLTPANIGAVTSAVQGMGNALGDAAKSLATVFAKPSFSVDLALIFQQFEGIVRTAGLALGNFVEALADVMVAARPLTDFLSSTILRFSEWAKSATDAGRETGALSGFFESTIKTVQLLGNLLGPLGSALKDIFALAKPLGDQILKDLGGAAQELKNFTSSAEGIAKIKGYFEDIKPALYEVGRLIRDLVGAFFELSKTPGFERLVNQIRTEMLPAIVTLVTTTTQQLGPALIDLVTNVAKFLGIVSGATGPLTAFVRILGDIIGYVVKFAQANPEISTLVVSLISLKGVLGAISFVSTLSGMTGLMGMAGRVAVSVGLIGPAAATSAATTTGAFAAMQAAGMRMLVTLRAALITTGIGAVMVGLGLAALYVITHWDKVKDWFARFGKWLEDFFGDVWRALKREALEAVLQILEPFSKMPGKMGQWARDAKVAVQAQLNSIEIDERMMEQRGMGAGSAFARGFAAAASQTVRDSMAGVSGGPGSSKDRATGPGANPTNNAKDEPANTYQGPRDSNTAGGGGPKSGNKPNLVKRTLQASQANVDAGDSGASQSMSSGGGGSVTGDLSGLRIVGALQQMSAGTGTPIYVQSGFRSSDEQAALVASKGVYNSQTNPQGAAPVGTSLHETGNAADITPGREVFGSVAGTYGLSFPVPGESWHCQGSGGTTPAVSTAASTGTTGGTTGGTGGTTAGGGSVAAPAPPPPPPPKTLAEFRGEMKTALKDGLDAPEVEGLVQGFGELAKKVQQGFVDNFDLALIRGVMASFRAALKDGVLDASEIEALVATFDALPKRVQDKFQKAFDAKLIQGMMSSFKVAMKDGMLDASEVEALTAAFDELPKRVQERIGKAFDANLIRGVMAGFKAAMKDGMLDASEVESLTAAFDALPDRVQAKAEKAFDKEMIRGVLAGFKVAMKDGMLDPSEIEALTAAFDAMPPRVRAKAEKAFDREMIRGVMAGFKTAMKDGMLTAEEIESQLGAFDAMPARIQAKTEKAFNKEMVRGVLASWKNAFKDGITLDELDGLFAQFDALEPKMRAGLQKFFNTNAVKGAIGAFKSALAEGLTESDIDRFTEMLDRFGTKVQQTIKTGWGQALAGALEPFKQQFKEMVGGGLIDEETVDKVQRAMKTISEAMKGGIDPSEMAAVGAAFAVVTGSVTAAAEELIVAAPKFGRFRDLFKDVFKDGLLSGSEIESLKASGSKISGAIGEALNPAIEAVAKANDDFDKAFKEFRDGIEAAFREKVIGKFQLFIDMADAKLAFAEAAQTTKEALAEFKSLITDGLTGDENDALGQKLKQSADALAKQKREYADAIADLGTLNKAAAAKAQELVQELADAQADYAALSADATDKQIREALQRIERLQAKLANISDDIEDKTIRDAAQKVGDLALAIDRAQFAYDQAAKAAAGMTGALDAESQAIVDAVQRVRDANAAYYEAIANQDQGAIDKAIAEKVAANAALRALDESGLSERAQAILAGGKTLIAAEEANGQAQVQAAKTTWQNVKTAALAEILTLVDDVAQRFRDGKITWADAVSEIGIALEKAGLPAAEASALLGSNVSGAMEKAGLAMGLAVDALVGAIDRLIAALVAAGIIGDGEIAKMASNVDKANALHAALLAQGKASDAEIVRIVNASQQPGVPPPPGGPAPGNAPGLNSPGGTPPPPPPPPPGGGGGGGGGAFLAMAEGGVIEQPFSGFAMLAERFKEAVIPMPPWMDGNLRGLLTRLAHGGWKRRRPGAEALADMPALVSETVMPMVEAASSSAATTMTISPVVAKGDGGVIPGPRMPAYGLGGVSRGPEVALVGESFPEAHIPLPPSMNEKLKEWLTNLAEGGWKKWFPGAGRGGGKRPGEWSSSHLSGPYPGADITLPPLAPSSPSSAAVSLPPSLGGGIVTPPGKTPNESIDPPRMDVHIEVLMPNYLGNVDEVVERIAPPIRNELHRIERLSGYGPS